MTLGDGLEEIGERAFEDYESLEEIVIPPAVRDIHDMAFIGCTNLTRVKFCDKIEEFVSCDAMSDWWNGGFGKSRNEIPFPFPGIPPDSLTFLRLQRNPLLLYRGKVTARTKSNSK